MEEPILMGSLKIQTLKGKEIFSFEYNEKWLAGPLVQQIDPDLKLYTGPQYLNDDKKTNFGLFLDSSPDRWGRTLMKRREILLAKENERKGNTLFESDFLLGVNDHSRIGALRFKIDQEGSFLDD